ncbi:MAG: hypothetical protein ACREL3_11515 [Gemmatimonadales bacterium]
MTFFLGVDLGQASDYTALAVLERGRLAKVPTMEPGFGIMKAGGTGGDRVYPGIPVPVSGPDTWAFKCRHLERLRLGTSYPAVADRVTEILASTALQDDPQLVVDATGVGRAVVDLMRQRKLDPIAVSIHGGDQTTFEQGWRVPKRDLVSVIQVLLQTDRFHVAEALPEWPILQRELLNFKVKIDPLTAHDSYGAWREGSHDDLVLAVAVAAWWGMRYEPRSPRNYSSRCYASL